MFDLNSILSSVWNEGVMWEAHMLAYWGLFGDNKKGGLPSLGLWCLPWFFWACAYHDGIGRGARSVLRQFCLCLWLYQFCWYLWNHVLVLLSWPQKAGPNELPDSFAWVQSAWNLALNAGLICSWCKWESSLTACHNRTITSMLAASDSLPLLSCWSTDLLHTFKIPKVAFCKGCCMLLTLKPALPLKWFIWSQISGLTVRVVMWGQFSGWACLDSSGLSLSLGRVIAHCLDAM